MNNGAEAGYTRGPVKRRLSMYQAGLLGTDKNRYQKKGGNNEVQDDADKDLSLVR